MACGAANLGSKQIVQYQADYIFGKRSDGDQERTLPVSDWEVRFFCIDHSMPRKRNTLVAYDRPPIAGSSQPPRAGHDPKQTVKLPNE
jgi:hypothetical protein